MSHIDADAPENEGKDFDGNFIEVEETETEESAEVEETETEDDTPVVEESDEDDDVVNADEE